MTVTIGRRELLAALGAAAAAWPLAARAAIGDADDRIPQLGLAPQTPHMSRAHPNGVNSGLERRR
jgi:hypothetical protein